MPRPSALYLAAALLATVPFSGCGVAPTQQTSSTTPVVAPSQPATPATTAGAPLKGSVHGGAQPVSGSHIYLFAANPGGYGTPSISLLDATQPGVANDAIGNYVVTDSSGNFNISGTYVCSAGQQVYLLATGGDAGAGVSNPALSFMALFGACPTGATNFAGTIPFITINEVSTIASVYALSGFMTDETHVSSSSTPAALQGIANAFNTFNNIADLGSGTPAQGNDQGNNDVPQAEINSLADLLVPCANSSGNTGTCATLFNSARDSNGNTPENIVSAALNIAHNPGANVSDLFSIINSSAPFQPVLPSAPNDWTIALTFYSDFMVGPYFPAIDSAGNIWVPGFTTNNLTELDPNGNILSGQYGFSGGGLTLPYSIAIDAQDNPWVVNFGPLGSSSVSKFLSNGTPATSNPYPCSAACFFGAFDNGQNLWLSGSNQTTVLSSAGSVVKQFSTSGYDSAIAISSTGVGWTIGHPGILYHLALPSTIVTTPEGVTSPTGNELTGVAFDSFDNAWFASSSNSAIGKVNRDGGVVSPISGFTGGGLKGPAQLALDGGDRVWVVNRDGNTLSCFSNAGTPLSPSTGYQAAGLSGPRGLAIDGSGNVWVTNFTYNSITEFVGVATPVVTPISPSTHGQRP